MRMVSRSSINDSEKTFFKSLYSGRVLMPARNKGLLKTSSTIDRNCCGSCSLGMMFGSPDQAKLTENETILKVIRKYVPSSKVLLSHESGLIALEPDEYQT